ncbi:MFS transporter [Salirhabdus salicampi]|uniref:MFS transporter n=1 Tax=Salirhabdus salicampi TaxID=476102 RepID=UPI0020C42051|nr:MFS transporter [Salirhabdus salicampi]MCP8615537.1 MFS transporter [Salirhabdus salicampi]
MLKKSAISCSVLIICGIFIASNIYTMLPLQHMIADQFAVSLQSTSLASFCFVFTYAFGLLIFGICTDKYNERSILLIGMLILSVITFATTFVKMQYTLLLVCRTLQGFFAASFAPAAFSYIFRFYSKSLQTVSIALLNTGFLFAGIFGQIISAYFAFQYTFSSVFYMFAIFYVICLISLFLTLQHSDKKTQPNARLLKHIVTLIRFSPLQKLYITAFFLLFTIMLFYSGLELYLVLHEQLFSYTLQTFRMVSLVGIVPAFFARQLVDRYGAIQVLIYSLLLMAFGFMFPMIHLHAWTITVASISMIASTSLTIPMVVILVGRFAPSAKGRAISLYSFTLLTGASFGSIVSPFIPFPLILATIFLMFICLAQLIRLLRKQEKRLISH